MCAKLLYLRAVGKNLGRLKRSSRLEAFYRKGVLINFAKSRRKHLCQSLNIIKKETLAQVFSCEFCEIYKNTFFLQNTSGSCFWLKYENLILVKDFNVEPKVKQKRSEVFYKVVWGLQLY